MVACTPHPGLGTVAIQRPAIVQVVDLATCTRHVLHRRAQPPSTPGLSVVVARHGDTGTQTIAYRGRSVLVVRENYARAPQGFPGLLMLRGMSPDRRWVLYAIDSEGSASLAADGLPLRVVSVAGGPSHPLGTALGYDDYLSWCSGRLVFTAGGDREATIHKRLDIAGPPDWKPHVLTSLRGRAWGSVACAPDQASVVVQSQPAEQLRSFFATRWQLWRVRLDGAARPLTHPSPGYADESPRFSPDGTIYFVRSTHGNGELYALRSGRLTGPLVSLGYSLGYYGANAWSYSVRR